MKQCWYAVLAFCLGIGLPVQAADPEQALQFSRDFTERVVAELRENQLRLRQNPDELYELAREIILPHIDFVAISRWILGRYWRKASKGQKIRFVKAFRVLMVRTYAQALLEYHGTPIQFLSAKAVDEDAVTVRAVVLAGSGSRIPIVYSVHHRKGRWQVYDIRIDGISLVINYRGSFTAEVRKKGLEAVIAELEKKPDCRTSERAGLPCGGSWIFTARPGCGTILPRCSPARGR